MRSGIPRTVVVTVLVVVAAFITNQSPSLSAQSVTKANFEPEVVSNNAFPLTIESIMRGPEHIGRTPSNVRWSDDGEWVYFRWLPGGHDWHADLELYRVHSSGGEPELVDEEMEDALAPILAGSSFGQRGSPAGVSPDGLWRTVSSQGDLFLIERSTQNVRRLTYTEGAETAPSFSGDGTSIFFRQSQNLFAFDIEDASVRQLTFVTGPEKPEDAELEGHKLFLEEQQTELFKHIQVQELQDERREARNERREKGTPQSVHLSQGENAQALVADPTGRFVAVTAVKSAQVERTDIPLWVTQSGYTENTEMRTKVGDEQSQSRVGVVDVKTGEMTWLDLTQVEETSTGEEEAEPGLAFANFVAWNDSGSHGLFSALDDDYNEWRVYALETASGELTRLATMQDEAWIGGPCLGFRGDAGCIGWLPSHTSSSPPRAWYVSEETGYAHLYAVDADGQNKKALTGGDWEVLNVSIPNGWDAFLLQTSELSPFDQHPWRMDFDGSDRDQLLEGTGSFTVTPSPDGRRFAVIHSSSNRPPELSLADVRPGADLISVTTSPTNDWLGFPWLKPEIIHFEARDGTAVPARIYRSSDFGVESNGAGVVFVHGAGYMHNVHNWWSNYYREYMFHHFLAAQGYTVLDIDYRGSAGYGRDWRTAIYRHMGGWDLSDQVDGAQYLVDHEGVNADRLGVYGGSYGGFITLMALFTEPEVFEAGAALRAVTDWAHYNHGYTARILNPPHEDEEAYRQSSPIYFAEGLRGHLLMAHGMYDTNVHFSDIVRLTQRLIELGKDNWELASYPVENHGFQEPASWTDEYRRIYELFDRVIGTGYDTKR